MLFAPLVLALNQDAFVSVFQTPLSNFSKVVLVPELWPDAFLDADPKNLSKKSDRFSA
jgi:hypothetical protein